MQDNTVYTARSILDMYVDLECLQPAKELWDEISLQNNEPQLFRLKILKSLFGAFGLGDLKDFDQGTFIVKRKLEDYGFLTKKIISDLGTKPGVAYSQALDLSQESHWGQVLYCNISCDMLRLWHVLYGLNIPEPCTT